MSRFCYHESVDATRHSRRANNLFTEEAGMAQFNPRNHMLVGPGGELHVSEDDEISRKLLMLIEGECGKEGPL